ncbi:MAG TPA: DUF6064 family protein [Pyrinomonadaceae bacterium]|nr:DUF6064 family protein [Pyrinomonadaceae bacterium]
MPFTVNQFFEVFARYNLAVWPAQLFLYALAIFAMYLAIQRKSYLSKRISYILAGFWIWMGLVYHFWYFSTVNRVALIFAASFVLQGILFFIAGGGKPQLNFRPRLNLHGIVGGAFLLYALIIYPALGYWFGHRYPAAPTFGLPCPTTIFTFGMLLWIDRRVPLYLLAIPLAWSFIGVWAAISLGVSEDYGLLATGVIASGLIVWRDMNKRRSVHSYTVSADQLLRSWRS